MLLLLQSDNQVAKIVYIYCFYICAQLAQWLNAYITVPWIVLESSSVQQQSDQSFYRYTTFHLILQFVLNYNQLMTTKKPISSLCKVYSVYEEIQELLDETDLDNYFYHNILDTSQSHH